MGKVIVGIRVMPVSPEIDLSKLKEDIRENLPEEAELRGIQEKYIAFGLTALDVTVTIPDNTKGGSENVEKAIQSIPEVQSIDILGTGLL